MKGPARYAALVDSRSAARTGRITDDIAAFAALLRDVGHLMPPSATVRAVQAVTAIDVTIPEQFHAALRACLAGDLPGALLIDEIAPRFFGYDTPPLVTVDRAPEHSEPEAAAALAHLGTAAGDRQAVRLLEGGALEYVARAAIAELRRRTDRRWQSAPGGLMDVRRSLRQSVRTGGDVVHPSYRALRRRAGRLLVLVDVSGSMAPTTPLSLGFARELIATGADVEVVLIHDHAELVTDVFRRRSARQIQAWVDGDEVAVGGGTALGRCVQEVVRMIDAHHLISTRDDVWIISDGWDDSDLPALSSAMAALARRCGRIIWIDPHAEVSRYVPRLPALRVAAPFLAGYLDFAGPAALTKLPEALARCTSPELAHA